MFCACCREEVLKEADADRDSGLRTRDAAGEEVEIALPVLPSKAAPASAPVVATGPASPDIPSKAEKARIEKEKQAAKAFKLREKEKEVAQSAEAARAAFEAGDWDTAVAKYSEVLSLKPGVAAALAGRGGALLRKGQAHFKLGDLDGAIEDYNKKLALAPADGKALCGRGEARLKKGDRDGAITDFEFATKLSYPGAKELLNSTKGGSK
jgi:tetratricopeptide (TPR) repeat protein